MEFGNGNGNGGGGGDGRKESESGLYAVPGSWELGTGRWPWELVAGGEATWEVPTRAAILLSDTVTWSPGHCTVGQGKQERKGNLELHCARTRGTCLGSIVTWHIFHHPSVSVYLFFSSVQMGSARSH